MPRVRGGRGTARRLGCSAGEGNTETLLLYNTRATWRWEGEGMGREALQLHNVTVAQLDTTGVRFYLQVSLKTRLKCHSRSQWQTRH